MPGDDELIVRVREGLSRVLVISGEAGIGKTRLLNYPAGQLQFLKSSSKR
ncbi:hypothetical protein [Catenulispora rubra]|nr:hypothetical protein [Catenulispora rubra]